MLLSVSSNGSTWVKLRPKGTDEVAPSAFSILERIDVGETSAVESAASLAISPFSILERIDVGETAVYLPAIQSILNFQYPRTDRRG